MKVTLQKQEITRLLRAEDSSAAELGSSEQGSSSQDKTGHLYVFLKVFLCYVTALTITLLLSRLH